MFHVVLYRPEIPPNTGNIMRLCASTASTLHLIHPLGFSLEDQLLRRAGLDYREWADVEEHDTFEDYLDAASPGRLIAFTRNATRAHTAVAFSPGDALLFGPESDGLPEAVLSQFAANDRARIPMVPRSRSLNLSNAVAIALYEALRQHGFPGLTAEGK
ncbi:MAG: tRNA (cytidine(34)-2'-O)-methyltransferase [Acidimicrobiia bacterium]|nr:tRNA (cytidine(34)-2'-O)-methyltransferase [Acidimicrobiia bacterium]MBT8192894.1 tRNA (cytidine(34)-2'-O)-methyltransferase [Acidimicrobiia bacterium]MBT8248357.1 tRNA (cytidine(34)-2'-O)-methyltransferase [Acidimicrobiia bacterium]NNF89677.1 tRNA (cytidine(34)-2'-O)-methyltransferase [Acidimicrobiia bacterium]NNJ46897.1 tRNA (cytidine(34)-2'-O)-methyltransferase [Acidimicrobiia bacterium]